MGHARDLIPHEGCCVKAAEEEVADLLEAESNQLIWRCRMLLQVITERDECARIDLTVSLPEVQGTMFTGPQLVTALTIHLAGAWQGSGAAATLLPVA